MDIDRLTHEQNRLVEENTGLVWHIANKFYNIKQIDYEDLVSIGTIGLIKASRTFNESKGTKFATYACRCITNEILMAIRKDKRYESEISLEDTLNVDWDGNELTLSDILSDPKSDFVESLTTVEDFIRVISIILNALKDKQRVIMLYALADKTQLETATFLNISQSYVSRLHRKIILKIKKILEKEVTFKQVFSIEYNNSCFHISFSNSDVPCFKQAYTNMLNINPDLSRFIYFSKEQNEKRTHFYMLNAPKSYAYIAEIFQELAKLSKESISNPRMDLQVKENISPQETIKNYFLSLDFFTIKELTARFPNEKTFLIRSAVHLAETKGLITPLDTGKYIVNKTKP